MSAPLPPVPETYALFATLYQTKDIEVGRLGRFSLPAGDYAYLGSAHGPGGLRARLRRHLRGDATRRHWHIDYLRCLTKIKALVYLVETGDEDRSLPLECMWNQTLAMSHKAYIPVPGFGASDCPSRCEAHLVHFPVGDILQPFELRYTRLMKVLQKTCNCELVPNMHVLRNEGHE